MLDRRIIELPRGNWADKMRYDADDWIREDRNRLTFTVLENVREELDVHIGNRPGLTLEPWKGFQGMVFEQDIIDFIFPDGVNNRPPLKLTIEREDEGNKATRTAVLARGDRKFEMAAQEVVEQGRWRKKTHHGLVFRLWEHSTGIEMGTNWYRAVIGNPEVTEQASDIMNRVIFKSNDWIVNRGFSLSIYITNLVNATIGTKMVGIWKNSDYLQKPA